MHHQQLTLSEQCPDLHQSALPVVQLSFFTTRLTSLTSLRLALFVVSRSQYGHVIVSAFRELPRVVAQNFRALP